MDGARRSDVVGAVLAGGAASRMGGDKASALFGGRPLIDYPLEALRTRLSDVVVVAKAETLLPGLAADVGRVDEPAEPRHPATGIVAALEFAAGRPVVVLSCDLPGADSGLVDALLAEPAGGSAVVAGMANGRVQPLVARYEPAALDQLRGFAADDPMTRLALGLGASLVAVDGVAATGVDDRAALEAFSRR